MRRTGKAIGTLAAATSLALVGSGLAFADVADNDVSNSANGSKTIDQGGSVDVKYWIKATRDGTGAGDGGACNVSSASQGSVVISMPAGVNAIAGTTSAAGATTKTLTLTFEKCGDANENAQTVTFSAPSNATYATNSIIHTASGGSPAVTKDNSTDFSLVFADVTKPVTAALSNVSDSTTGTAKGVTFTASATDNTGVIQLTCAAGTVSLTGGALATAAGVTSRTFTGSFPIGDTAVSCSSKDAANNNSLPQAFTVGITQTPADSTPPVITPTVTGTEGLDGWYTTNVGLSWSVTDAQSALSSTSNCDDVSITADQAVTTYTCSATSAGGTNSGSVSIKRDAAAPIISGANVANTTWRNSSLSQAFTASDARSGILTEDESFTLTASAESVNATTPTRVSKTVTDAAGNSSSRTLSALIDLTGPTGVAVNGVAAGAEFFPHELPTGSCAVASDALSGVASGASTTPTQVRSGSSMTYRCSASDVAGNSSSAEKVVVVKDYGFTKLLQPVDQSGVYNRAKAGSTVPVKFVLSSGATSLAILDRAPEVKQVACPSTMLADAIEELSAASASGLVYLDGQHKYEWKTASTYAGKCYELTVPLKGGEFQTAKFHFTK